MKIRIAMAFAALLAFLAGPVAAHHSFAAFDLSKEVRLEGTLTEVRLTNPHSWFVVEVVGADGKPARWSIEGLTPAQLFQKGLKRSSLKPGDKVTIVCNPLRSGEVGGSLVSMTLADGTVITGGPGQ